MRGEAAQLASTVVLGVPCFGVVDLVDIGVSDGVQDCEGEVGSIGGVEQGLGSVFSAL